MSSLKEVLAAARSLPEDDRLELIEELSATFEPEDKTRLDDEWLAEIQRRSREYDAGRMQAVPWEAVKEQARKRVVSDSQMSSERMSMNATSEQLLDAALALPEEDRREIAEALAASVQPADQPPFDESWREVIQRRSAELQLGQVRPVPWSEVKRRARDNASG